MLLLRCEQSNPVLVSAAGLRNVAVCNANLLFMVCRFNPALAEYSLALSSLACSLLLVLRGLQGNPMLTQLPQMNSLTTLVTGQFLISGCDQPFVISGWRALRTTGEAFSGFSLSPATFALYLALIACTNPFRARAGIFTIGPNNGLTVRSVHACPARRSPRCARTGDHWLWKPDDHRHVHHHSTHCRLAPTPILFTIARVVQSNPALTTMSSMGSLATVTGITIGVRVIDFLSSQIHSADLLCYCCVFIQGNPLLAGLPQWPRVTAIAGAVSFSQLNAPTPLTMLRALRSVGTAFTISVRTFVLRHRFPRCFAWVCLVVSCLASG